jgi:hypothetical protein
MSPQGHLRLSLHIRDVSEVSVEGEGGGVGGGGMGGRERETFYCWNRNLKLATCRSIEGHNRR